MRRFALVVILAIALPACGGGTAPVTVDPNVDVGAIIEDAATAMGSLGSARFRMERAGAAVEVAGLEFVSAEGQYSAPDSARAILQVNVADLAVEVGTIAIGDQVWLTNPLTGGWERIAGESGFNIAIIFDPEVGWVPLLTEDLTEIEYRGLQDAGSGDRHVIHGVISAGRVEFLTAGLVEAQSVEADIWIHPDSAHITRVAFETTLQGAASQWLITMTEFDRPVSISAPSGA